jgi:glycosyltransferase involved in cell wall biosynthesis
MRELCVVSVAAESARRPWGGITAAVGLMARGLRATGGQLIECAPGTGAASRPVPLALYGAGPGANPVYSAADRSRITLCDPDRAVDAIKRTARAQPLMVLVQNEELALVGAAIADRLGVPQVQCLHGGIKEEHGARADALRAEADAVRLAQAFVAFSAVRAAQLSSLLGIECHYLPLPLALLDDGAHPPGDGGGRDPGLVFAAGRAVPQKNLGLMALIAPHLRPPLRVEVAVGHGDPRLTASLTARLRSAPRTTALPWLPARQVTQRLRAAAVLVVPSAFEPLGLIAAEAFAAGCVVVAAATGGLGELVSPPAGITVAWSDDQPRLALRFARAVNDVSRDPHTAAGIRRAQRERLRGYGVDAFCRGLAAIEDQARRT